MSDLTAIERQLAVHDLNARYVEAIDEGRFEDWPAFFLDDGHYRVTTAENAEQGLPLSMIYATSRAMLRDRVRALREANVYEAQRYRHILGPARIEAMDDGSLRAATGFMVARIMHTGETALFATGRYLDRIVLTAEAARFAEKTVILDSRQVDTLLAIPL
jgi:3-phenylpropionate/cinnamic acid dioxygenase small subunit